MDRMWDAKVKMMQKANKEVHIGVGGRAAAKAAEGKQREGKATKRMAEEKGEGRKRMASHGRFDLQGRHVWLCVPRRVANQAPK